MDTAREQRKRLSFARRRLIVAAMALCVSGCTSPGDVELLESQLRRQEDQLRSYRTQLSQSNQELQQARREIDQLHRQLAAVDAGGSPLRPEQISALAQVESIAIDTWRSGLMDRGRPEAPSELLLILYPQDADGEIVKVGGELVVAASDPGQAPGDPSLGQWSFDSAELAELWHAGLVGSGFHLQLPLLQPPAGSEISVFAMLQMADGREFSVTQSLRVRGREYDAREHLLDESDFFPGVGHAGESDAGPLPLSTTGREIRVPEPPGQVFTGTGEAETPIVSGSSGDALPSAEGRATHGSNRHLPTATSDNWTVETIPILR
jgi:hypothetical protein